jgi:hypothetical protein
VLVIDGASRETVDAAVVLPPLFVELYNKGLARRDAIAAVEVLLGVAHREAYDAALAVPVTGDEGRTSST